MNPSFGGWTIVGIAAAVLIVAGIVLLIGYAAQRGLVHRELDGIVATDTVPGSVPVVRDRGSGRTLGAIGAVILVIGLGLGVLAAVGGWGDPGTATGPGTAPVDCAQSWSGCPQATPGP